MGHGIIVKQQRDEMKQHNEEKDMVLDVAKDDGEACGGL
jgi:hypothetical protein